MAPCTWTRTAHPPTAIQPWPAANCTIMHFPLCLNVPRYMMRHMESLDEPLPLQSPSQLSTYECFQAAEVFQELFIHQNGLCIIRVAPNHPALQRVGSAATAVRQADPQQQAPQSIPAAVGQSGSEQASQSQQGGTQLGRAAIAVAAAPATVPAAAATAAAAAVDECAAAQETSATAAEASAEVEPQASISFDAGRQNLLHVQMRKGRGPMLAPDSALCK